MGGLESPNQCGKSTLPSPSCLATRRSFHIKRWFPCSKIYSGWSIRNSYRCTDSLCRRGRWLDEIDLKDLLLPLYVIDKSKEVAANPNFILSKQDILDFEAEHGQIAEGAFVAFRSDWSKRWPDQDAMRNLDENGVQQSPGWSREALEFLIHERHVKAVGHETFDTDAGIPAAEHGLVNEYYLLEQNIYQVEVLNQLDQVPAVGALISIAFPHWDKATGSPVRAIAILP